ncbi:hypothetical protein WH43_14355 [Rheinheimera sp. KL1]|uniref:hypothetical protein n=1 Tax=Rheinheimera sp. KL1 TaxID=1635005 RepID=UPI0006A99BFB|nr:hypothetical protein [Rheinheimera sp. KL1]KOO57270.1 hypothetical protein WH43_14355 [Rheinheimera sp. KL1]
MSIQIKVSALKDRRFKAPVTVLFASDEVKADGSLKRDELKFVGLFRSVPEQEIHAHIAKIESLRKNPNTTAEMVMNESREHIKSYFVGVEKLPSCDYPFLGDDGQPKESSPELIHDLLSIKEIRDAVESTYKNARDSDVLAKN